jgi:hypothetical protein
MFFKSPSHVGMFKTEALGIPLPLSPGVYE